MLIQEAAEHASSPGLVSLQFNLMLWTLIIFGVVFFLLSKLAFPKILGMVEAREKALDDAITAAKQIAGR